MKKAQFTEIRNMVLILLLVIIVLLIFVTPAGRMFAGITDLLGIGSECRETGKTFDEYVVELKGLAKKDIKSDYSKQRRFVELYRESSKCFPDKELGLSKSEIDNIFPMDLVIMESMGPELIDYYQHLIEDYPERSSEIYLALATYYRDNEKDREKADIYYEKALEESEQKQKDLAPEAAEYYFYNKIYLDNFEISEFDNYIKRNKGKKVVVDLRNGIASFYWTNKSNYEMAEKYLSDNIKFGRGIDSSIIVAHDYWYLHSYLDLASLYIEQEKNISYAKKLRSELLSKAKNTEYYDEFFDLVKASYLQQAGITSWSVYIDGEHYSGSTFESDPDFTLEMSDYNVKKEIPFGKFYIKTSAIDNIEKMSMIVVEYDRLQRKASYPRSAEKELSLSRSLMADSFTGNIDEKITAKGITFTLLDVEQKQDNYQISFSVTPEPYPYNLD